ncbi:beta-eliminating lyase-related protein [Serratia ureilytica]
MAQAEVGDDVYGDDPTVNALEAEAVRLSGKEALLLPSGTRANLRVALRSHRQRGDEYLVGQQAHNYNTRPAAQRCWASIQPAAGSRPTWTARCRGTSCRRHQTRRYPLRPHLGC